MLRLRATLPSLGVILVAAVSAHAGNRVTAVKLTGFEPDQVRSVRFQVDRAMEGHLSGVGAGGRGSLHAYGWLLRLDTRAVVWSMVDEDPDTERELPGGRELVYEGSVTLSPGAYALYYYGGESFRKGGAAALHHLFDRKSPDRGAWSIGVSVSPADRPHLQLVEAEPPDPEHDIRLAPLGDNAFVRRRFRLADPTDVVIDALGEADRGARQLADRSYLLELTTRKVVWALDFTDSQEAGGAHKNRQTHREMELKAGSYELVAGTDDSHSADGWNSLPPHAAESWGVELRTARGRFLDDGLPAEHTIVRLAGVTDDESLTATFRLDRPTHVRVYAFGEWSGGSGELADSGSILDATGAKPVWTMSYEGSEPAGGASKNRVVDTSIELPAGTYRAVYTTDDSHAYGTWNGSPPADAGSWGMTLSTFDPDARFEVLTWGVPGPGEPEPPKFPGFPPHPKKK